MGQVRSEQSAPVHPTAHRHTYVGEPGNDGDDGGGGGGGGGDGGGEAD